MLNTKLIFSIDLVPIASHDKSSEFASSFVSTESASSFASHVHESHEEINNKVAQNIVNYEMRVDDRHKLKDF